MRNPSAYRLASDLAITLPAESGREVAAALELADTDPNGVIAALNRIERPPSKALARRARDDLRTALKTGELPA